MANGIIQFVKDLINDNAISTKTTYSSDKIEQLITSLNGIGTEVILGCFATAPTTFIQDDQYYDTTDGKIYKAISATTWDGGNLPKEDVLYASIDDKKIYSYIKGVWDIYGGGNTKISKKSNNILLELTGQANKNDDGLYVPLSKKSGNVIEELTGQATDINNGLYVGKSAKTDNALQKLTGNTNPSEDGLYVKDLEPEINLINQTTKINKEGVQEYLCLVGTVGPDGYSDKSDAVNVVINGKYDLFYLLRNENLQTTIDDTSRYDFSKNGTSHLTGSYITLKAGVTYKIQVNILSSAQGSYYIYDENDKSIGNRGYTGTSVYSDSNVFAIVKYNKDTKIFIKYTVTSTPAGDGKLYPSCSFIKIESMSYLTIDPLQYVDNTNGTQDTPVGTIINVMGNNAPKHYLKCDGAEYNIADYPYLAEYFRAEFGSINKFGGDGITTFRTPDLKGEFLRGTGVNGHTKQGSGSAVGTHQNATEVAMIQNYKNSTIGIDVGQSGWCSPNFDTTIPAAGGRRYQDVGIRTGGGNSNVITTRPTNTSVLYCIKAEPTYFINVIGTTIEDELLDTPTLLAKGNDITLQNSITDYDEIELLWKHSHKTLGNMYLKTLKMKVKDIEINTGTEVGSGSILLEQFSPNNPNEINLGVLNFKDNSTLYVIDLKFDNTTSWNGIQLYAVRGYRTTSVVQGRSPNTN